MTFSVVPWSGRGALGVAVASRFLAVGASVPAARVWAGAVATQALPSLGVRPEGLARMAAGAGTRHTLEALAGADDGRAERQCGLVDAAGGSATLPAADHAWMDRRPIRPLGVPLPDDGTARRRAIAGKEGLTGGVSDALILNHLVKDFGPKRAVDDLSLTVAGGSVFGLVGPNGAGKTTTLSMTTGLLRPTHGQVLVEGVDVWADPPRAKALMGVLPDGLRLFDRLSGRELLRYVGLLRRVPLPEVLERSAGRLVVAMGTLFRLRDRTWKKTERPARR